jgi:hypothetical protein
LIDALIERITKHVVRKNCISAWASFFAVRDGRQVLEFKDAQSAIQPGFLKGLLIGVDVWLSWPLGSRGLAPLDTLMSSTILIRIHSE